MSGLSGALPNVLFRSDSLVVRAHLGRGSRLCFVVFDPMVDDGTLDRTGFAEAFLASHGHDAVHVLSAHNRWYQDAALLDALVSVRAVTGEYERVVAYGSSMGGYAALRFSDRVGAHAVIAVSPQYSVLPSVVPFETRWITHKRDVTWLFESPGDRLPAVREAFVVYDDHGLDRGHAKAILDDLPNATPVPVAYGGHPAGAMLAEIGVLSSLVLDAAQGRLDRPELALRIRRARHRSGHYLYTLARRQPFWRLRLKARLAERATQVAPDAPVYLSYAGLTFECVGRVEEALRFHRAATVSGGYGVPELRLARALWRAGQGSAALVVAERAALLLPRDAAPTELLALGHASHHAADSALLALASDPRLRASSRLARTIRAVAHAAGTRTRPAGLLARWVALTLVGRTVLNRANILRELAQADVD